MSQSRTVVEQTFLAEHGRVLAALISHLRDFDLAEDVLQEAMIKALEVWEKTGIPHNPGAWLTTTAKRRAIDRLRRRKNFEQKQAILSTVAQLKQDSLVDIAMEEPIPDERLKLMFTCCHPALSLEAQVALTLRTLGGLTTTEIAKAFLLPEKTMAKRLQRAKGKIKNAGIPYRVPPPELLSERINAVLSVIYLIFNEGYSASSGEAWIRAELCDEAIRLCYVLTELLANTPELQPSAEALGLLAMMILHHARRHARIGNVGEIIVLEDQDRTLWDREAIKVGVRILDQAMALRQPGAYQVQAAISALHCDAEDYAGTDWKQIILLYNSLYHLTPSPIVALNRAVAVAMVEGALRGLMLLDQLEAEHDFSNYLPFYATRADLLRRAGWHDQAHTAFTQAQAMTNNETEQAFFARRLAELNVDGHQ